MHLKKEHTIEKPVSVYQLFHGEGITTSIQIIQGQELKAHSSKVPALLLCVQGEVVFENENGVKELLKSGDYVHIEPLIKHWVLANVEIQLILLK